MTIRHLKAVLALISLCGLPRAAAAAEPGPPLLDLVFSRKAARADLRVERAASILLRADRDITSLKLELTPAGGRETAGVWSARLVPLPRTEEPDVRDAARDAGRRAAWVREAVVAREKPPGTTVWTVVPRAWYASWLLVLAPRSAGAEPVDLTVRAAAVSEEARVKWLAAQRARFDPEADHNRVRSLVRYLTDDEVRRWAGVINRRSFQLVWRRMSPEQIAAAFPEEGRVTMPPYKLPGGVNLLTNARGGSDGPAADRLRPPAAGPAARPPRASSSVRAGAPPPGPLVEVTLGQEAPLYAGQLLGAAGEYLLRVRVRPEVRGGELRFWAVPGAAAPVEAAVTIEGAEWQPVSARESPPFFQAALAEAPDPRGRRQTARLFKTAVGLPPREREITWILRLRIPEAALGTRPALPLGFRIETDARPISEREQALMEWREKIDPIARPEEVRAKVAELTDEEVRYYTGFRDRAAFLKHWMRTRLGELFDEEGTLRLNEETWGLTSRGYPLPNGRYLHHHGKPGSHPRPSLPRGRSQSPAARLPG